MQNFANWPLWIKGCMVIATLTLVVAGLRSPQLMQLANTQPEATSTDVEPQLLLVPIVIETEEGEPIKGASIRFSYKGSPTERITTDDGYAQIQIPSTEDVSLLEENRRREVNNSSFKNFKLLNLHCSI